jgi:hypothetical protein
MMHTNNEKRALWQRFALVDQGCLKKIAIWNLGNDRFWMKALRITDKGKR